MSGFLEAAARFMTVEVGGQTYVAGREAYVLTMTPAATDTALGKIEAAIDGRTFVPLRLEVVAKGGDTPTLSFGFTRVSYEPVDDAVFVFTPPEGAKVERETVDAEGGAQAGAGDEAKSADAMEQMKKLARTALLTRPEAAGLVDFPLAWARDYTARDFRWAYVFDEGMPVNALGSPVFDMVGMTGGFGGGAGGGDAAGGSPPATGPAAVLLYGEGFRLDRARPDEDHSGDPRADEAASRGRRQHRPRRHAGQGCRDAAGLGRHVGTGRRDPHRRRNGAARRHRRVRDVRPLT